MYFNPNPILESFYPTDDHLRQAERNKQLDRMPMLRLLRLPDAVYREYHYRIECWYSYSYSSLVDELDLWGEDDIRERCDRALKNVKAELARRREASLSQR